MTLEELFIRISGDNKSLKDALTESENKLDAFGKTALAWGEKLIAALGLFELGKTALEAAEKFEEADLRIARSTGATGEALHGLEDSFRQIYQQTPAAAEAVTSAMDMIFQRTGRTGEALEEMTLKMLKLAKVSNEDVAALGPLITRVFGDWGMATEKQGAAMDYLRVISQQTGTSVSKLAEQVVYAGAPLRQMGYDFEEAAALIGKFEKEGVNTELVLGGMKAALSKFAKEGVADTAAAWDDFVEGVKSGSITLTDVMKEVGAKRGVDLFKAITEGRFEIDKMVESAENLASKGGAAVGSMASEWGKLKHTVEVALEPLAGPVLRFATDVIAGMTKQLQALISVFKDVTTVGIVPFMSGIMGFIKSGGDIGAAGAAYGKAMAEFKKGSQEAATATQQATKSVQDHGAAQAATAEKVRKATEDHKNWQQIVYKSIDMMVQAISQTVRWNDALNKAHDELAAGSLKLAAVDWTKALPAEILQMWTQAVLTTVGAYENWKRGTEGLTLAHAQLQGALQPSIDLVRQVNAVIVTQEELTKRAADAEDLYTRAKQSGMYTDLDLIKLEKQMLEAKVAAGEATEAEIARLKQLNSELDVHVGQVNKTISVWQKLSKDIYTALTKDLSQGITDVILHGKNLGDVFKEVGDKILSTILDTIIEKGIKILLKYLGDVLDNLGGIGSKIGGILSGGAGSAAGSAGGAVGGAAGGGGSSGGGGGGGSDGAGGAVGGWLSLGAQIATAVSSIIGNFQSAHMETSLNAIEHNTRYTMMYIGERADGGVLGVLFNIDEHLQAGYLVKAVEDFRNKYWNSLMGTWEKLDWIATSTAATVTAIGGLTSALAALGDKAAQVTINITSAQPAQDIVGELKRLGIRPA